MQLLISVKNLKKLKQTLKERLKNALKNNPKGKSLIIDYEVNKAFDEIIREE